MDHDFAPYTCIEFIAMAAYVRMKLTGPLSAC